MRLLLSILLFLLVAGGINTARAQYFYRATEYGISAGASQYFGDLNDNYGFQHIREAGGVFMRLHLNPYIGLKALVNYTTVGYDDKYSDNPYNKQRNLNFTSNIYEVAIQAEFNFFRFETGNPDHRFTPYLTGGIGAFYYNPYTTLNGVKYNLQPLGTEGQNSTHPERRYSNTAICFPVGAGVKYWVKPGMNIGFEIVDRLTTTDYLDDVSTTYAGASNFAPGSAAYALQDRSAQANGEAALGRPGKQRGNESTSDQYLMFLFQISFQFRTYKCPTYLNAGYTPSY